MTSMRGHQQASHEWASVVACPCCLKPVGEFCATTSGKPAGWPHFRRSELRRTGKLPKHRNTCTPCDGRRQGAPGAGSAGLRPGTLDLAMGDGFRLRVETLEGNHQVVTVTDGESTVEVYPTPGEARAIAAALLANAAAEDGDTRSWTFLPRSGFLMSSPIYRPAGSA